jgi:hypothetical protein
LIISLIELDFEVIIAFKKWANINWAGELLKLGPPNLLFGLLKK